MANEAKTNKAKNKNKNPNKVKIFLANPTKPKCPPLEDADCQQLQELLIEAIDKSQQIPRAFATAAHISLGLESSLRAINSGKASCVLVSTSIKPRYLLGLVARNVETHDETTPTYTQTKLEDFTEKVFGVRALALVLPKDATNLGLELINWIDAHRKPRKTKVLDTLTSSTRVHKKSAKSQKTPLLPCEKLQTLTLSKEPAEEIPEIKPWGSEYLSFSKESASMEIVAANSDEDENNLMDVLDRMSKNVKQPLRNPTDGSLSVMSKPNTVNTVEVVKTNSDKDEDQDDFLNDYAPLVVHKICPNPERKPRKKRKKHSNKQQNKK